MPEEKLIAAMATYHEELAKAGVLLDASGLQPTSKGFRVKYSGSKRTVIDGPFAETKELIAGYTTIQVKSKQEAIEWARRFPNPHGEGIGRRNRSAPVLRAGGLRSQQGSGTLQRHRARAEEIGLAYHNNISNPRHKAPKARASGFHFRSLQLHPNPTRRPQ